MTEDQAIRAFIAAMLPPHVRDMLVTLGSSFAEELGPAERALRWVRPEGLHLTFHFERALSLSMVPKVGRAMGAAAARHSVFTLNVSGIGAFPDDKGPRVIWAGVGGDLDKLNSLARSVAHEMQGLGLRPDKAFKAHLTLARVRDGVSEDELAALASALNSWRARKVVGAEFQVDELTLVRSQLDPGGSIYTPLGKASLQRAEE